MSKITESARGEECQVRIPGVCNFNQETTVFAHLNGYGMGGKNPDLFGAYACSACHDVIDGRARVGFTGEEIKMFLYDGIVNTQRILLGKGLVKI